MVVVVAEFAPGDVVLPENSCCCCIDCSRCNWSRKFVQCRKMYLFNIYLIQKLGTHPIVCIPQREKNLYFSALMMFKSYSKWEAYVHRTMSNKLTNYFNRQVDRDESGEVWESDGFPIFVPQPDLISIDHSTEVEKKREFKHAWSSDFPWLIKILIINFSNIISKALNSTRMSMPKNQLLSLLFADCSMTMRYLHRGAAFLRLRSVADP
uniref:Uncharacterized protein n=1 Tax=Romanomermis culicivorax TaxID=13658 RepID=A0A915K2Q6_ROMCU